MRLPLHLIERTTFVPSNSDELCTALGSSSTSAELEEIQRLCQEGLPPVTSLVSLSAMTGFNPGFIWALSNRTPRYYRVFEIPKGRGTRRIEAPRVSLKLIQKWLAYHFSKKWTPLDEVHGFVPGRSHLTAASAHLNASWVLSIDLSNFFPSTPSERIAHSLRSLGYRDGEGLDILVKLLSYNGRLSQGAPTSPIISNIALSDVDIQLLQLSRENDVRFTRYADDLTFSGMKLGTYDVALLERIREVFAATPWRIAEEKVRFAKLPARLKVHGLLVHGDNLRLTKGYRNRIRAYRHLSSRGAVAEVDMKRVAGHLNYAAQVERRQT